MFMANASLKAIFCKGGQEFFANRDDSFRGSLEKLFPIRVNRQRFVTFLFRAQ